MSTVQTSSVPESTFKTMTLSECAKFDKEHKVKDMVCGWGKVCKSRQAAINKEGKHTRQDRKNLQRSRGERKRSQERQDVAA